MGEHLLKILSRNKVMLLLALAVIFFVSLAVLANGKQKKEKINFTMAELFSEDTSIAQADLKFAELVKERTKGRIVIDVKFNAELGSEEESIAKVRNNEITMARVSATGLMEYSKTTRIFQIPFLFDTKDYLYENLNSKLGDDIYTELQENNLTPLCYLYNGKRNFCFTSRVENIEGFKGKKIRVNKAEMNLNYLNSLKANPVPLDPIEVSSAFEAKNLDGAEVDAEILKGTNIADYAKYILILNYKSIPACMVINSPAFENLSEDDRKIIKECAREASRWQWQAWEGKKEEFDYEIRKKGCIYVIPNDEEIEAFKKQAEDICTDAGWAMLKKYNLRFQ